MKGFSVTTFLMAFSLFYSTTSGASITTDSPLQAVQFQCISEAGTLPPLSKDSEKLFQYGKFEEFLFERGQSGISVDDVARYYRIAAAQGHYNAAVSLIHFLQNQELHRDAFAVEINAQIESLIGQNISLGYYEKGQELYFQNQFPEARAYFRRAADLGNALAQVFSGDMLNNYTVAVGSLPGANEVDSTTALSLYECAASQGEKSAFRRLGDLILFKKGQLTEALLTYQKGINAGDHLSILTMQHLFSGWSWMDVLGTNKVTLQLQPLRADPERARRYGVYLDFVESHASSANLSDVNKIIPLPPAELPAWDGVVREDITEQIPQLNDKPADELVNQMADEKGLNHITGLPN